MNTNLLNTSLEGVLLLNKPLHKSSFYLVYVLRKIFGVKKIGHAGTLDPFATGVMVMLIGRSYTKLSETFLCTEKEYVGTVHLGISTDTYDCTGNPLFKSDKVPTLQEIESLLPLFQGDIFQTPPMYSAKKVNGKKLYEIARKTGEEIERKPCQVQVQMEILEYVYPFLKIHVTCSKGTYIRSIAHDLGTHLGCGAHLSSLQRIRSGDFHLEQCVNLDSDFETLQANLIYSTNYFAEIAKS